MTSSIQLKLKGRDSELSIGKVQSKKPLIRTQFGLKYVIGPNLFGFSNNSRSVKGFPMSEHLKIRNFGPIKSADINVNGLTVFVGAQATGKSLAAQLLYFMRQVENLLIWKGANRYPYSTNISDELKQLLSWWIGNNATNYFRKDTFVSWITTADDFEIECSIEGKFHPNRQLEARIQEASRNSWERQKTTLPLSFADIYIPAGRSLYSFLPPSRVLRILSASPEEWPGYIYVFYEILGESINRTPHRR